MYVYYHLTEIVSSFHFAIVGVFIESQIEIYVQEIKGEGHLKKIVSYHNVKHFIGYDFFAYSRKHRDANVLSLPKIL